MTTDLLASLVAEAWPNAFTAVNIMAGFKKTGIHPLNPGEVTNQQLAPSKAFCSQSVVSNPEKVNPSDSLIFSQEKEALYQQYFEK